MRLKERWDGAKKDAGFYIALAILVTLIGSSAYMLRKEAETVSSVLQTSEQTTVVEEEMVWPIEEGVVFRAYGAAYNENVGMWEFSEATEIAAAENVQVAAVRPGSVYGYQDVRYGVGVEVRHTDGTVSRYMPVQLEIEEATKVKAGEPIGLLAGSKLYFVMLRDGKPVAPE